MFLINFQLWARNRKIPVGGGSVLILGEGLVNMGRAYVTHISFASRAQSELSD